MTFTVPGIPIAKPRMTRRDKWKLRLCVLAYRDWCDRARAAAGLRTAVRLTKATRVEVTCYLPRPRSWSNRKAQLAAGQPHLVKPDGDNLLKAVCDGLFANDQAIYSKQIEKYWDDGRGPRCEVVVR